MMRALGLAVILTLTSACSQQTPAKSTDAAPVAGEEAAAPAPETAVDAFSAALGAGDTDAVRRLLADDVVIAESGAVERSFAEYAGQHLPADMAFAAAVTSTIQDRKVIAAGDMATVISRSEVRGSFRGRAIHSSLMETMVLRRMDGAWRIVHIHWSSSPITNEQ